MKHLTLGGGLHRRKLIASLSAITLSSVLFAVVHSQTPARHEPIVCRVQEVMDPRAGVPAFTYLLPKGWVDHSSWNWQTNSGTGITSSVGVLTAQSPDKQYGATIAMGIIVGYMHSNAGSYGFPITKATDFFHHFLEGMQSRGWSDLQIVSEKNQPFEPTRMQQMGGRGTPLHELGTMVVNITNPQGQREQIRFASTVSGGSTRIGQTESGTWSVGPVWQITTPLHPTPHGLEAAWLPIHTFGITPQENEFDGLVVQANNKVMGNRFTFKNQMLWHSQQMQQFEAKMHSREAQTHDYTNYVLGKADYETPDGQILNLQDHGRAWKNGNDILYSDDPTFNPRTYKSSNEDWTPLKKVKGKG